MRLLYRFGTGSRPRLPRQEGSALIWALFFVAVTAGLLVTNSWEMQANRTAMDVRYRKSAHARLVAQSALTDATAWFQRQAVQPVAAFAPQLDAEADPPLNETIDPTVGLVREFEVRGGLWARYEVRKGECIDVSAGYGEPAGVVWDIGARGIVYEHVDANKAFNQAPNRVVAQNTVHTEVRGVPMNLPAASALSVGQSLTTNPNVTITGDATSAAITYKPTGGPLPMPVGNITGTPTRLGLAALDLSTGTVFKMRPAKIESLADTVLSDIFYRGSTVFQDQLIYAPNDLVAQTALRGRMVLFVNGNFVANPGTGSDLAGVVVVGGNATIYGPFRLRGSLLVRGNVQLLGAVNQPVQILYDASAIARVKQEIGKYRKSSDTRPSGTNGAFTPVENLAADYTVMAVR